MEEEVRFFLPGSDGSRDRHAPSVLQVSWIPVLYGPTMTPRTLLITAGLTLAPIFELRGGLPYALTQDVPLLAAFVLCVVLNALVGPLVFLVLRTANRWLSHLDWYQRVVGRILERARRKVQSKVDRYGYLGLALFVSIPLPITGAYTGAIGAWVLGLDPKRSYLAISLGVIIAAVVVSVVTLLGIEALSIFVKEVHP